MSTSKQHQAYATHPHPPSGVSSGEGETYTHSHEVEGYIADDEPSASDAARIQAKRDKIHGPGGLIKVQPLAKSEMQPSYAQNLGTDQIEHGFYGSMMHALGSCVGICGSIPCCPFPNPFKSVPQGNVGLVSRFGQFYSAVDPGLVSVNVCTESIKIVDVRIRMDNIPSQSVMTKDNVSVSIDSVICYAIENPYRATYGIDNVRSALIERAQTTLRQVVGARSIQSVVTEREAIALEIEEIVETPAAAWGVKVESILIKDIVFSQELQESLSSAAQAKRVGEAKVIAARAEVQSARLMREAADILASPAAMSIRTLDALQNMAKQANTKVVFVPMNLSNMGAAAPGQGSGSLAAQQQPQIQFKEIVEHADEGSDFMSSGGAGQGPAGAAGQAHAMASI